MLSGAEAAGVDAINLYWYCMLDSGLPAQVPLKPVTAAMRRFSGCRFSVVRWGLNLVGTQMSKWTQATLQHVFVRLQQCAPSL